MLESVPYQVLIIEDNLADTRLLQMLFSDPAVGTPVDLHILRDGNEASEFISKKGKYQFSPTPDMVLMDLNLPRKDGWELLRELKSKSPHRRIPVIMLSTSNNDREIAEAYELGATAFISKPIELSCFRDTIRDLCHFWFRRAKLATRPEQIPLERTA
jgi:two-component system, chemotaxis family, response regulator Rcp1